MDDFATGPDAILELTRLQLQATHAANVVRSFVSGIRQSRFQGESDQWTRVTEQSLDELETISSRLSIQNAADQLRLTIVWSTDNKLDEQWEIERRTQLGKLCHVDYDLDSAPKTISKCPFSGSLVETSTDLRYDKMDTTSRPEAPLALHAAHEAPKGDLEDEPETRRRKSSDAASASKCPIRMLDNKPVEEIAEYIDKHKHEVPRSHELCVKRYQSNTESIQKLDAKYGNLVNMIQALGSKHQPMLQHEGDDNTKGVSAGDGLRSNAAQLNGRVEEGHIDGQPDFPSSAKTPQESQDDDEEEERIGHFDRPLPDVRLGESPSRPWGIQVPADAIKSRSPEPRSRSHERPPAIDRKNLQSNAAQKILDNVDPKSMTFTGPVFFIGYPPEQAASFAKHFQRPDP